MATRKPKNPELAAAASNLGVAARHIRRAVRHKVDELGASAAAELGKARRQLDAQWKKVEARLIKATNEAKRSLHRAAREAEKTLQATRKAAHAKLAELQRAGKGGAATKKVAAKKAPARKAAVKRAPVKKAAVKKAAARKTAV
jgi:hypothetical protein